MILRRQRRAGQIQKTHPTDTAQPRTVIVGVAAQYSALSHFFCTKQSTVTSNSWSTSRGLLCIAHHVDVRAMCADSARAFQ